ncbi:MAG: cupin domain-containing protein [Gammaproteobacteria bacterium]|nr:cupin domain-containing protein [Gammaproteobacteria bacterium]MDH5776707.1 cupin domain-containing protein [Gammaproteobacteria bacterium]
MLNPDHILGSTSIATFLSEHWQQKPLLIRAAIVDYVCPISADEMAGLACEEEVESRIILEQDGDHPWQCLHGPFEEIMFEEVPSTHWTLLLQSLNLHIHDFAELLERFRFIPNWRVDDVMLSYAAPGGSVGPHTDNYDVFLLQASGKRRWGISNKPVTDDDFIPDLELKVLKSFEPEQSWVLEAGDMLYLPPGVIHHGVAVDDAESEDCITISIGFRAPNVSQLSSALLDDILEQDTQSRGSDQADRFYQDANLALQENPGEISHAALAKIKDMVQQELNNKLQDSDWFGKFITNTPEIVTPDIDVPDVDVGQCLDALKDGQPLVRNEASKLAYFISEQSDQNQPIHFFYNGRVAHYPMSMLPIIQLVCNHRYPPVDELNKALHDKDAQTFLAALIDVEYFLYLDDEDDT